MTQIQITNIPSTNVPYDVYVCNIYGTGCVFISSIGTLVPPSITIILPSIFDTAPAIVLKIVDNLNCVKSKIIYCTSQNIQKQFQDLVDFDFQDGIPYQFPT